MKRYEVVLNNVKGPTLSQSTTIHLQIGKILGAKFGQWANFPWFSEEKKKKIRQFWFFSKND